MNSPQLETGLTRAARYLVPFILLLIVFWRTKVNTTVPEPYLDEVFHVGQAQAYWAHNWTHWDPKITTPPGLYLWSYLLCAALLFLRGSPKEVGPSELRTTNVAAMTVLLPWRLQTLLDLLRKERNTRPSGAWVSHTVLNICLFPPLFFFSALYYTDILALLVVAEAYIWDIKRSSGSAKKTWSSALLGHASLRTAGFLVFGLAALAFRQTNIFWVSVFLGGLQVVRTLRENATPCKSSDLAEIIKKSSQKELYDPLVEEASFTDYFKTALSLLSAAISNLPLVVASVLPHLVILAAFGLFVLWNGGVVLGHKEFHTAGLHVPQMLYIWPYFVFFSWPLLLIAIANLIVHSQYLPKFFDYGFKNKNRLPGILTALGVISFMLSAIHFNTIVHPFTLADNRHYVFYVFRILTRYHPAVKYAVAPIYFLCAWGVLTAFGFSTPSPQTQVPVVPTSVIDSATSQQSAQEQKSKKKEKERENKRKSKAVTQKASSRETAAAQQRRQVLTPEIIEKIQAHILQRQQRQEQQHIRVSFVLVWLISTTLSLITAPLVEPRYFIIPWVMWRLHLPRQPTPEAYRVLEQQRPGVPRDEKQLFKAKFFTDLPQVLETIWFIAINAITGYVFLYKGFEWPQEPGKVQRFMW